MLERGSRCRCRGDEGGGGKRGDEGGRGLFMRNLSGGIRLWIPSSYASLPPLSMGRGGLAHPDEGRSIWPPSRQPLASLWDALKLRCTGRGPMTTGRAVFFPASTDDRQLVTALPRAPRRA